MHIYKFRKTVKGRGEYFTGEILLQDYSTLRDLQGSVLYNMYCPIDSDFDVLQILPRLREPQRTLLLSNLTPFEILLMCSERKVAECFIENAKVNSPLIQIDFDLDNDRYYLKKYPKTDSIISLFSTTFANTDYSLEGKEILEYQYIKNSRSYRLTGLRYSAKLDNHRFDKVTVYYTDRSLSEILFIQQEDTVFVQRRSLGDDLLKNKLIFEPKYIKEGSYKRSDDFDSVEIKYVKNIYQCAMSICAEYLHTVTQWTFEGTTYSLRMDKYIPIMDIDTLGEMNAEDVQSDLLLKELLIRKKHDFQLWDDTRECLVATFKSLDNEFFGTGLYFDHWELGRVLYSLVFGGDGDRVSYFPILQGTSSVPYTIAEGVRQHKATEYEPKDFSDPETTISKLESAYSEVVTNLIEKRDRVLASSENYIRRSFPLITPFAIDTDGYNCILYSPTFFKMPNECYIFGYSHSTTDSFSYGQDLHHKGDKFYIYDIVFDLAFRKFFTALVLQILKDSGETELHYDDGASYGCILDLEGIPGLRIENDTLYIEGNTLSSKERESVEYMKSLNNALFKNIDPRGNIGNELLELAYGKSK
jgi:hypothetical protein